MIVFRRILGMLLLPFAIVSGVSAQSYTVTISGAGSGSGGVTSPVIAGRPPIACIITAGRTAGNCAGTYSRNTRVTLTAQSTGTSTFTGWTGACSGMENCVVRQETGMISVTAAFTSPAPAPTPPAPPPAPPSCTLAIGTATGGTAALDGGSLTGACGRSVTLTATPAAGYRFASWTGGATTNPLTLIVDAPTMTVTPGFVQQCTLAFAAIPSNGGTSALTAGALTGDCGRSVTVVASPNATFTFTGWSDGITSASRALTVTGANQILTATFTASPLAQCAIVLGPAAGGTAALTVGEASGACGRSVTVTATPASGFRFGSWLGGSTANPLSVVVSAPTVTVTPAFLQQCTLTLEVTPDAGGTAAITSGAATGDCGRSVTALATVNPRFTFGGWSDGSTSASRAVTVTGVNQNLTATFVLRPPPQCTLVIGAVTGGSAAITSGSAVGACDRNVMVTATPAAGYRFGSWTGGSTSNPLTVVVNATTVTITPAFVQQCTLTLAATPANGGTTALTAGSATGDCTRSVTVSATAAADYTFTRWSDGATTPTRGVTVGSSNQVLTATFAANAPAPSCTITIAAATGGTATLATGPATGTCGRSITLAASPESGYRFDGWSDGSTSTPYTFALTTEQLTLTPRFVQQCTLVLSLAPGDGGSARITPDALAGDCGRTVVVEATPAANFGFVNWSDGSLLSSRQLTVSTPRQTLTATFSRVLIVRIVISGAIGSVLQPRAGRTACASSENAGEHVCALILTGPDTLVAMPTATSGFNGWSGACSGRATCAVTGTEQDEVRASFITVPTITADAAARDMLTGTGLTAAERELLDRAGNGDGTYNLGDLLAHLERTNQQVSASIAAQLLTAPTRHGTVVPPTSLPRTSVPRTSPPRTSPPRTSPPLTSPPRTSPPPVP